MSIEGSPEPTAQASCQPARCEQPAAGSERFWDLKASHSVEVFLSLVLIGIGLLQYCVYSRQAGIMETQTGLIGSQLAASQIQTRSYVYVVPKINVFAEDQRIEGAALVKTIGATPAYNVQIDVALGVYNLAFPDPDVIATDIKAKQTNTFQIRDQSCFPSPILKHQSRAVLAPFHMSCWKI